jgi:hypothetical protein
MTYFYLRCVTLQLGAPEDTLVHSNWFPFLYHTYVLCATITCVGLPSTELALC